MSYHWITSAYPTYYTWVKKSNKEKRKKKEGKTRKMKKKIQQPTKTKQSYLIITMSISLWRVWTPGKDLQLSTYAYISNSFLKATLRDVTYAASLLVSMLP